MDALKRLEDRVDRLLARNGVLASDNEALREEGRLLRRALASRERENLELKARIEKKSRAMREALRRLDDLARKIRDFKKAGAGS